MRASSFMRTSVCDTYRNICVFSNKRRVIARKIEKGECDQETEYFSASLCHSMVVRQWNLRLRIKSRLTFKKKSFHFRLFERKKSEQR